MDANVLIDLCEADRTVIRLISEHVGQVHVPLPVLREEVNQIDEAEYAELGIVPVEPPLQNVDITRTLAPSVSALSIAKPAPLRPPPWARTGTASRIRAVRSSMTLRGASARAGPNVT